jgi:hypothetical protein
MKACQAILLFISIFLLVNLAMCDDDEFDESPKNQEDLIQDELKLMNEDQSSTANRTSSDEPQDRTQGDEDDDSLDTTTIKPLDLAPTTSEPLSSGNAKSGGRSNKIASLVKIQIKKELRKLKSSMTDSIMEEVINYYGKKLDSVDGFKEELSSLSSKFEALSQSMNSLSQNFKTISRNHRNLVDVVRNNLLNKNDDKAATKGKKNSIDASVVNVLKKKSTDNKTITQDSENLESLKSKIKAELFKELESKYVTFKVKSESASIEGTDTPIDSTTTAAFSSHSTTKEPVTFSEYSILNNKPSPTGMFDKIN